MTHFKENKLIALLVEHGKRIKIIVILFTPTYKRKERIPNSWIDQEVEMISKRLLLGSDHFYIPLLFEGNAEDSIPERLFPKQILNRDFRNEKEDYVRNLLIILKDKLLHPEKLLTNQIKTMTDLVNHPFHDVITLKSFYRSSDHISPYKALMNLFVSGQEDHKKNELFSHICDAVFYRTIESGLNDLQIKNWTVVRPYFLPVLNKRVEFSADLIAACSMFGVHYFWLCWLCQLNGSMVYDQATLNYLTQMFSALRDTILQSATVPVFLPQIMTGLNLTVNGRESASSEPFMRLKVYEQLLQLISIESLDQNSASKMYRLVAVTGIPIEISVEQRMFARWKILGQQYLSYYFAKRILINKANANQGISDLVANLKIIGQQTFNYFFANMIPTNETDANTDHYLRLATRLGCQPSWKQWDEFIDQMLLCHDEERCEEDERILLGFARELKMNMKSVMHHRDNKDRKIVEKIAEYIIKHSQISGSRQQRYQELKRLCPEIEWQSVLTTLIPKELRKDTQWRVISSLSGERYLKEECVVQIYDATTNTFKPKDTNHNYGFREENGRHIVAFVKNHLRKNVLCFKQQPEFPMIEQAGLELMYGLFGYPGIPFSEVMKWNVDRQRGEGSQLFLVSAYVEGIRADEVFSNADHADMINKLDEQRVGELIIYSILSNPEDGRLQNYIFVRSDRDASLYKIVAIDIDHSFAAAIPQKLPGWFSGETKTSSMLFTLPLMSKPIAESIQERLRKLDVDELFVGWLDDLERLEHEYRKLYNENEEERADYEKTTTLTLPMNYVRLMHVYWKLEELKSFVMDYERTDETTQPTYMEALKRVEKYTGDRYEAVNESTLLVGERFMKSDGRLSSSMIRGDFRDYALRFNEKKKGSGSGSTALETITQVRESLRQKKQQQQHQIDIEEFEKMKEEFKRLSAAEQEELFVSYQSRIATTKEEEDGTRTRGGRGRGKALDDAEIERKWLDLVSECVCEWQRLIIRHNGVLRKSWFVDASKTAFYNLTLLELHDCSEVTGEVLDILSARKSCRLEGVILSSLENLRTLCARTIFGRQTNNPLELPDLRSIRFINNVNLKRIHINSAKLRHLVIEGCSHIEWMSFGNVNHLKSLQYDEIIVRDIIDSENQKWLNFVRSKGALIFNSLKLNCNSKRLSKEVTLYRDLNDFSERLVGMHTSSMVDSVFFKDQRIAAELEERIINKHSDLVKLYDHFLAINRPYSINQSEILQSSYNSVMTLFQNNNPNPKILEKEIENYLRVESLYLQFLKNKEDWGKQLGISGLKNYFDYYRFINGKLVFNDPNKGNDINMKEFSFRQFANKLEGEFDLSGLKDKYFFNVSDDFSINIGYRKQKISSHIHDILGGKTEVWIVPKFMVEKDLATSSSNHLEWYLDEWSSPVGIFFTRGDWDDFSSDSYYITNQQYNQINNQTLYSLCKSSEKRIISYKGIDLCWVLENFSFVF